MAGSPRRWLNNKENYQRVSTFKTMTACGSRFNRNRDRGPGNLGGKVGTIHLCISRSPPIRLAAAGRMIANVTNSDTCADIIIMFGCLLLNLY